MTKKETIQKIVEILERNKYSSSYAGDFPHNKDEYAKMIWEEVIKEVRNNG